MSRLQYNGSILAVLCVLLLMTFTGIAGAAGSEDLNKEFAEKFFQIGKGDADIHLRVQRKATVDDKVNIGSDQSTAAGSAGVDGSGKDQMPDPSWVGKFLQVGIVLFLILILLFISRRTKRKRRY